MILLPSVFRGISGCSQIWATEKPLLLPKILPLFPSFPIVIPSFHHSYHMIEHDSPMIHHVFNIF